MKIVADKNIPYLKGVFEPFCDIEYLQGDLISNRDLTDCSILIVRTRTRCNSDLLEHTPVKLIATATIGYDHIDIDYCKEQGIAWVNAAGCNARAVQQWVMAAILSYAKQHAIDLTKRTLGVVGVGHVGRLVVDFAEAVGMSVLLNDPPREREINKGTILINSSRGEVVDTSAIVNASSSKAIGAVLIDVWEGEPNLSLELLRHAAIATPHIAGYSFEGKANGTAIVVEAVAEFLNLPLSGWYPDEEHLNAHRTIQIDATGLTTQEILTEALLTTYDINSDDKLLRENFEEFEQLRANYSFRHEVNAYSLKIKGAEAKVIKSLERLGFEIVEV
jgi:erythronate-4-phosphate dehydrogenase